VPVLACHQCGVWQYAQVSYVMTICCVACGERLKFPTRVHGQTADEVPGFSADLTDASRREEASTREAATRRPVTLEP
jgi:predicted  nucleic acid-binding Zn-ribbon protein